MDDPLMWAVLPLGFTFQNLYMSHRWSFGSHDICFKNSYANPFQSYIHIESFTNLRQASRPPSSPWAKHCPRFASPTHRLGVADFSSRPSPKASVSCPAFPALQFRPTNPPLHIHIFPTTSSTRFPRFLALHHITPVHPRLAHTFRPLHIHATPILGSIYSLKARYTRHPTIRRPCAISNGVSQGSFLNRQNALTSSPSSSTAQTRSCMRVARFRDLFHAQASTLA